MQTIFRHWLLVSLFLTMGGISYAQNLLHSGIYYDSGTSFDGRQWMQNTPIGSAFFKIYEDVVYFDQTKYIRQGNTTIYGFSGRKYVKEGSDGGLFVVINNNFDIIHCLTLTFWGQTTTTAGVWSKVPPSNQSYNQNQNNNTTNRSNNSNPSGLKKVTCNFCHGTGYHGKEYAPRYSYSKPDTWCPTCGKFDYIHHHKVKCPSCAGRGWNYSNY